MHLVDVNQDVIELLGHKWKKVIGSIYEPCDEVVITIKQRGLNSELNGAVYYGEFVREYECYNVIKVLYAGLRSEDINLLMDIWDEYKNSHKIAIPWFSDKFPYMGDKNTDVNFVLL